MRRRTWWVLLLGGVAGLAGAASSACSSDTDSPDEPTTTTDGAAPVPPGSDATAPGDAGTAPDPGDAAAATDAAAPLADGSAPDSGSAVTTFSYHPSWSGVTSASVWGQFGTSTDWTEAFLVLTPDGQGGFTGTAAVPFGSIPYILQAVGDADSGDAGKKPTSRYVVDPTRSAVTTCPAASPTYDPTANNPCSVLTVPSAGASVLHHVRGTVTNGSSPAPGWLVQIERNEGSYHHFFADRTTVGADGTFDLTVAEGGYELSVLNPTYLSVDDADQKPDKVKTYRREMTNAFPVTGDVDAIPPSVGYSGYAVMLPRGDAGSLPTTFTFAAAPGGTDLAVYDGASDSIGDPAYTGPGKGGTATFDGQFDKKKAGDAGVTLGARYFWGIEDTLGAVGWANDAGADAGAALQWTGQSLVYAIVWQ